MKYEKFLERTQDLSKKLDLRIVKKIIVFDEISSTNEKAKKLALEDEDEGTIIISKTQKKGRGRFNRKWESPDGGLYLSIILKPDITPDKTTILPLMTALAVSKAITSCYKLQTKIKWPNDVRINGKKVAGILLESEHAGNQLKYVVLGIGINLNNKPDSFPSELKNSTTSLSFELTSKVDYYKFLENLLIILDKYYSMFLNGAFNMILNEWRINSDTLDKKVIIETSSDKIKGKAIDIDQSGFLIVATESGETKKITSGDCIYFKEC